MVEGNQLWFLKFFLFLPVSSGIHQKALIFSELNKIKMKQKVFEKLLELSLMKFSSKGLNLHSANKLKASMWREIS